MAHARFEVADILLGRPARRAEPRPVGHHRLPRHTRLARNGFLRQRITSLKAPQRPFVRRMPAFSKATTLPDPCYGKPSARCPRWETIVSLYGHDPSAPRRKTPGFRLCANRFDDPASRGRPRRISDFCQVTATVKSSYPPGKRFRRSATGHARHPGQVVSARGLPSPLKATVSELTGIRFPRVAFSGIPVRRRASYVREGSRPGSPRRSSPR